MIVDPEMHRPRTLPEMRRVVHELLAAGYHDYDISGLLQLAVEEVRRLATSQESDRRVKVV